MKKVSYGWLLVGGALILPATMAAASASGSALGTDTTIAAVEIIDQTSIDTEGDLGLLDYFSRRKRTEVDEQTEPAQARANIVRAYDGLVEELGLIDLLLGKEPQPLIIAAGIPVVIEPVPEPLEAPIPEVGLISYLINRGHASQVFAKSATVAESAASSADLLRIKVVLGQLPRSALTSLAQSKHAVSTPKIENDAPVVENTDPQMELTQKHDQKVPATAAEVEEKGLLELFLHRRSNVAVVDGTLLPPEENPANEAGVSLAAETGELGILDLLFGKDSARSGDNLTTSADPD